MSSTCGSLDVVTARHSRRDSRGLLDTVASVGSQAGGASPKPTATEPRDAPKPTPPVKRVSRTVSITHSALTCARCGYTFARMAEKDRHIRASKCRTSKKEACPVCHSRLTPRKDAIRRHRLRTLECIAIQDEMSRSDLDELGFPSFSDRKEDMRRQEAAKKRASSRR